MGKIADFFHIEFKKSMWKNEMGGEGGGRQRREIFALELERKDEIGCRRPARGGEIFQILHVFVLLAITFPEPNERRITSFQKAKCCFPQNFRLRRFRNYLGVSLQMNFNKCVFFCSF